jgi:succinyl-diaminopimelate desuccinylase
LTEYLGDDVTLAPIVDVEGVWSDPAHPWMQEVFDLTTPIVGTRPTCAPCPSSPMPRR